MHTTVNQSDLRTTAADFGAIKAVILRQVEAIRQVAEERQDADVLEELREFTDKLVSNRFYLAVLGQFKRGKTTLINALLGLDVLPVAVVPLTSIITILTYDETPAVVVVFNSGETRPVRLEEIPEYVTERQNPQNVKGVKQVEVRWPSPYLKDGILLVDTPGVGSTYEHNTEVTHSFLARVDAAIFLVSVDPPLTQVEAEFLRRAKEEVHHFFFVLNKVDLMSDAEVQESLGFTREQIQKQSDIAEIEMFPLSARLALEAKKAGDAQRLKSSGLPTFETALRDFLMRDKGAVLLESSVGGALRVASDLRFAIEVEVKAAAVPRAELEAKQRQLEQELQVIEQERDDMNVLLANEIGRLVADVEKDLRDQVEASVGAVWKRLEEFYAVHPKAGRAELGRLMDDFMTQQVEAVFNNWRLAEDRRMNERFQAMSSRFTQKTNAIIRNIRSVTSRLFDIAVETFETPESLRAETHLYYKVDPLFYFTIDRIPFVLPKFLFRGYVLGKMRDRIRMELERNAGRIRYDYLERIEKSTNEFRDALNLKIGATLKGIRQAIERAVEARRSSSAEYQRQTAVFTEQSGRLAAVIERCRELSQQVERATV